MAKKNGIDMGDYVPKQIEYDAMRWCINNKIKMSPKAKSTIAWYIDIEVNGKITTSPESFAKVVIWKKIFEYYSYYYKKYEKKV